MQKQGCRKQWYRYHFDWYRYQSHTANGYRYHLPTASWVPYHFLVPVPLCDFCPENVGFAIFHPFFFTKLPQIYPTSKLTMESTQNNSNKELESIKIPFTQVRAFFPNQKSQKMRLGFDFLTLASSNLLFQVV